MASNKFNEASMFNMLTGIDRAIKSEAYKKYDLPTFDKGGKTGEEPPAKGAKKKAYQDAITANVYDYLKRTNYKTPHVPGKTIDDLGREMNCIHGVCQIVEGAGAKKFSQEYFGNMIFDDNMKKEGFYYAQPETEGFEVGDFLRFARTKGNANSLARYSGSVNPLNEDDLIPQHTSFILDKYVDDNGVTMYSVANNHGEEDVETTEISEQELLQWAQKGKGSFDKMLIARYDPDKVAEDAEKSEKINKILSGENPYASKYSGRKPGVKLKEKDELAEELLGYYKKNYEKLGKSSDLPPEVLDKLFVKQIGIAKQESTTGGRSIGKSMVPEPMLPYARKIADALFDNDNWILDYWNKNADDVKSKFTSIKAFTDYVTKDLKLDKEAREYLRYNSPASKGMFQQKELSQRGRFHKSGFDIPEEQFISSMDLAIDNYHKLKDKYPDMFEPELVELTTLMHNSPFKALTPEYVNYYLKNQDIDYVNKVNNYIPAYDIDRPIEKETELQKFIQKHARPLPITETANTVSPEEKKKIVNFLLNQNKKKEYGGELESFHDGGKKGTKENPFELPEITITPDTKRQAEMAEMYKYMPDDVKQAIAYDIENPDTLKESPEEQSYLSRGFDAITHPFAALGELHNRRGLQSNWLELNQERLGPNFLDWALYGAAAARFLPQAAKELPKYLSSSLPGMSKIPGATLGNALASEMIVNSALRETGLKGEEDPSTVREWEKYNEGSQDLGTTIANTGWNAMDALAFGELGPLKSQLAKDAGAIGEYLTTQTPLKETWRLNPKAYQYNLPENAMWRGLGQEGYEDAIASDLFRSKQNVIPEYYPGTRLQLNKSFGINPYFTPKFKTAATYGDKYLAEVPKDVANWTQRYARTDWSQVADRPIPISEGKILQKDWLRGYKQVNAPKASSRPVMQNSFPVNEIPEGESITGEAGSTADGVKPKLEEIKLENVNYRVDPQTGEDYLEIPVWQKRFAKDGTSGIQLQNEKLMEFTDKPKSTLKIEEPAPRDIIEGHEKEFELAKEFGYKWAMPDPKETFNIRGMLEQALQDVDLNKKYIDAKHASMKSPRVSTVEYNKYINEERPILEQNLQKSIAKAEELQKMLYNSIDPEFKAKVRNLMTESGVVNTEALEYPFHIEHMNPDRAALVNILNNDKGFANLSSVDKDYVIKNYPSFSGVRTEDAAITIGTRPSNYESAYVRVPVPKNWEPGQSGKLTAADVDLSNAQLVRRTRQDYPLAESVGRTTAHEIGHDLQKYFNWDELIVEHDPAYKYFVNKDDTNVSRLFKEYLVDPTPAVDGKKTYETWLGSGMEFHSDLMADRYELAKVIMEKFKVSLNTAIDHVKHLENIEDPDVYKFYLESYDLNKHFKNNTPDDIKKQMIKMLPFAAPAVLGTGAALSSEDKKKLPENKFGGNISNLQKFIQ